MDVVIIPAYEPDKVLITLTEKLKGYGFELVVVDDGSGEKYKEIFSAISEMAHIVTLPQNCGKGAALKAGMGYIKEKLPECEHFITCDADGQHRPEDVLRVSEQLKKGDGFVLTVRKRKGKIPFRSRFGNDLSKIVYTLLTNQYLSDNQSGLRGFAVGHLDWLIKVEKNNYDYEMNVLYYAAKMQLKISTLVIDAIYIENNVSSHFSPVADTIRIYKSLFTLASGTLISFLVAETLVLFFGIFLKGNYISLSIPIVGAATVLSAVILNKFVFLKQIPKVEYRTTLAYTIISYFVYTILCFSNALLFRGIPLILNFNIVYFLCMPLRYFLHQLIFMASIKEE